MYYRKRRGLRTISADLKVSEQCGIAASNGNQIIGLINSLSQMFGMWS